jgi:GDP-L-fucose synthase
MTAPFPLAGRRIWVTGHRGMVGGAVVRRLAREPCTVLTAGRDRVDLTRQAEVEAYMAAARPDAVVVAAARVGGIAANAARPAAFLYENLTIGANLIEAARRAGVPRLLFLGSSCAYPRAAPQPIAEDALLTGPLEPTNEGYAVAKIAGVKLCQAYRREHGCAFVSAMPTNLYGPHDTFDPEAGHVVPALMRRAHEAMRRGDDRLVVWGTGTPRRELLHVDDCADALVLLLERYSGDAPVNVGTGTDVTIREVAELIRGVVGFRGALVFDPGRPDGTPRKRLDVSVLGALGWRPRIGLEAGLAATYRWALEHGVLGDVCG